MKTKSENKNTANTKELTELEKQMRTSYALNIINQRKEFEAYFSSLYNSLNTQYNNEKSHTKSGKIEMLEDFINEISEALYKYKNNSNIHISNEEYKIQALQRLRDNFENLLNDLYKPENDIKPKGSNKTNKKGAGRPPTEVKPLNEYITKKWDADQKKEYVKDLKNEFQSDVINEIENENKYMLLKNLIYCIGKNYTKINHKKVLIESVMDALEIGDKFNDSSQTNITGYLKEDYVKNIKDRDEYKDVSNRLKKIEKHNFAYNK